MLSHTRSISQCVQALYCLAFALLLLTHSSATAQFFPATAQHFRYVFDIPGGYVNDHCLIYAQDTWHLFCIQGRKAVGSWDEPGNEVIIGHATSKDLLRWELQEPALQIGPKGSIDGGHIYAPSVYQSHGTYYMYYTGNRKTFNDGEHILLATSTDLFHWTRYSSEPVIAPDSSWASYYPPGYNNGAGGPSSCRDPHVILSEQGYYVCYYVAALKADPNRPSEDREYSCIAAATSTDLIHWKDHGPVLTRTTRGNDAFTWGHLESPCVIFRENRYYLFYKSGSGTRYVISDNPLDFHDRTEYPLSTSHASKVFEWNNQWYITSCSRDVNDSINSGSITNEGSDRTRGLFLAGITWNDRHPVITSLPEPHTDKP